MDQRPTNQRDSSRSQRTAVLSVINACDLVMSFAQELTIKVTYLEAAAAVERIERKDELKPIRQSPHELPVPVADCHQHRK
ncbi:hypothetical protein RB195_025100 [Necator americanus]|uniref:Uncharacterized protein n=1 Tax=Necator americanus TaxID=51031 RepID=A0ABR1EQW4_NECAM